MVLAALLVAIIVSGCSEESKKLRFAERADRFFEEGEYDKAKIEYLNLLREDPGNVTAIVRTGIMWAEQGSSIRAFPFLLKARELAPDQFEARIKLAFAFLSVGQIGEARAEAIEVLEKAPDHEEALLLLADTTRTEDDIEELEGRLAGWKDQESSAYHMASAALALRKGNSDGAELQVKQARDADPGSVRAHLALASIHASRKEMDLAAEELRTAAELAPPRSMARLRYAVFKASTGEREEGKAMLEELVKEVPDYFPAWLLLARLALEEGKYDESFDHLKSVFSRDPRHHEALLLQAQGFTAKGEADQALEALEQLEETFPKLPATQFEFGRAYLKKGEVGQAVEALDRAVSLKPDFAEAALLLAQLNLRRGEVAQVISSMEAFLGVHPRNVQAPLLLAEAYRAAGRLYDAEALFRVQAEAMPDSFRPQYLLGIVLRQQNKVEAARKAFEKAESLAPDSLLATRQLVEMDLQEKDVAAAHARAQARLEKDPDSAAAHTLQGRIYAAERNWDASEAALQKALDLDENYSIAYDMLISMYVSAGKLPDAARELESILSTNPENRRALTLAAAIYDQMGDHTKSQAAYEKLLEGDPDFLPALNNLAYIYSEKTGELEKAYDLASRARTLKPDEASVADTLGWILYKRGDYKQAMSLIQESAEKMPDNPEIQFHLGMANYMMGRTEAARACLKQAVDAPVEFPGKEEARRQLAQLEGGADKLGEQSVEELTAILKERPNDLGARMRLGAVYEAAGDFSKAVETYEGAFRANPALLSAATGLARLYAGPLKNNEKALEYSKKARELAQDDPEVIALQGRIVYQRGDVSWAYSLLQDSARRPGADPGLLKDFARAAYGLGKISESRQAMQRILDEVPERSEAQEAKTFLEMMALARTRKNLGAAEPEVQKILADDPGHGPALMVRAAIEEEGGEIEAAVNTYRDILQRFPNFALAQKELAFLYAKDPDQLEAAYELATKARRVLPEDAGLGMTLAKISYLRKEYAYAVQLLEESNRKEPLDAEGLGYLGLAQIRGNQRSEGAGVLKKAIEAGLAEPLLSEAKKALAESGEE